jgi:mRNA degradation ribonuclease J1/J2
MIRRESRPPHRPIQGTSIIPAQRPCADAIRQTSFVVLATGAQGEEFAALMRIATKQHKYVTFNERDTLLRSLSSGSSRERNVGAEVEGQSLPPRRDPLSTTA